MIDCKNLACPQPVLETKKALESLKDGELLEVLVDNKIASENVRRFLTSRGLTPVITSLDEGLFKISANFIKTKCESLQEFTQVLFLKSDKIGEGELGYKLMQGFLSNIKELDSKPEQIICVNTAVLIGSDLSHPCHEGLKALAEAGIKIISCSACLEYFAKEAILGEAGNAFAIVEELFSTKKVLTL